MSLFPYNFRKFSDYGNQGTPVDYQEAWSLAYQVFVWHSMNNTDDWTESNDGAHRDIAEISVGLMALLAEPSFVRMLAAMGEHSQKSLETLAVLRKNHPEEYAWFDDFVEITKLPIKV